MTRVWQRFTLASKFQAQVLMLAGSAAIGQVLVVLAAPIISRLFTPADFGINAGFAFLLTILQAINSLRYEFSIPLPDNEPEAANLVSITLVLVVVLSLAFTAIVLGFADTITGLLNEPRIKPLLPLLPVGLLAGGFILAFNYWLIRRKQFSTMAMSQIGGSIGVVSSQIALGVAQFGALGLAVSAVVGQLVSLIIVTVRSLPLPTVQPRTWPGLASRYKNFPLYTMPASLVDLVGSNLPAVLFLAFYSATEAGYFALTVRIMSLPLGIISSAVSQTLYPTFSEKRADPVELKRFFDQTASMLLVLSLAGFGFVLVAGDRLFALVFGEHWLVAGIYAQALAPFYLIAFITSPLSSLALVFHRQKEGLAYSTLTTALRIGGLLLAGIAQSPALAIALFSLSGVFVYLLYFAWLTNLAGLRFSRWLWRQRLAFGIGVALIAAGFAARGLLPPLPYLLVFALLFALFGLGFAQRTRLRAQ